MDKILSKLETKLDQITNDWSLSARELDIIKLILRDITSTKDVADNLSISPITVRNHLDKIYKKSGCKNKNALIINILHHYLEENNTLSLFYKQPKVLIVDDEKYICDVLEATLSGKGIKVYTTTKPEEVENLIKKIPFDFIISDMKMPNLTGRELIRQVKKNYHYWPQIIVMTGFSEYLPEELYAQGAISYINKPFKPDEIFNIILQNYSDEKNMIKTYFDNIDDSDSFDIQNTISLTSKTIGTGGAFLGFTSNYLKNQSLAPNKTIKLKYHLEDFGDEVFETYAEVLWRRITPEKDLFSGLGVKFINNPLKQTDRFTDFLIKHNIISFIPIGN
jgi:DNA-binding NarL/FixJ family response regulator